MASSEAALASATATPSSSARSIHSVTSPPSKAESDIEDLGSPKSFFQRFRSNTGLSVSDVISTEWCEKQMEFILLHGKSKSKSKTNKAMKAGRARHKKLEEEVVRKVKYRVKSKEDARALKLLNCIIGVNQLLSEGLTRELPLVGFTEEGIWMVGVIDEIRMPATETDRNPMLVDLKTRVQDTLPAEPQRRNGRLQLMCYKYMWDNLVADHFPSEQFFDFFTLNPHSVLSEDIRKRTADSGFTVETLDDMVRLYRNTFSRLPPAHDQLLLRYESQKDNSLLGEDQFAFDSDLLKNQLQGCLEFWLGKREACCTPKEERWKCRYCRFASSCPAAATSDPDMTPNHTNTEENVKLSEQNMPPSYKEA